MTSKPAMTKKGLISRYIFAFACILVGTILELMNVGKEFLGFWSVGSWLIFVGFFMIVMNVVTSMSRRKKIIDERMEKIGNKASRVTFVALVLTAFIIMVWDGISPITIPYALFMSHLISWMLVVYVVAYKILERKN